MSDTKKRLTDFEDFLENEFYKNDSPMIPKDDMSDSFNNWISNLDGDEFIKYAEQYANQRAVEVLKELKDWRRGMQMYAKEVDTVKKSNRQILKVINEKIKQLNNE